MRVLLDTNILLDVLLDRAPFVTDSSAIWAAFGSLKRLAQAFTQLIRTRQGEQSDLWLEQASSSGFPELVSFASGIKRDYAALKTAIHSPSSTGPVEGNINRLKFIKRSMYGRANFDLLRQRVLAG